MTFASVLPDLPLAVTSRRRQAVGRPAVGAHVALDGPFGFAPGDVATTLRPVRPLHEVAHARAVAMVLRGALPDDPVGVVEGHEWGGRVLHVVSTGCEPNCPSRAFFLTPIRAG